MTTEVLNEGADLAANPAEQVASLTATNATLTEQLAATLAKNVELNALVDAATEFKAAQEKAAAEAKVAARTAALADAVGTEQAASLQAAIAGLDDTAFAAVVTAMTSKSKVEASTPAFKEVGVEGSTDQTKLAAEAYGGKTADYLLAIVNKEIN